MHKGFWARLLILVLLITAIPMAATARAADQPAKTEPKLLSLTYNQEATAGSTVNFTARVQVDQVTGLCCATLTLKGPGGQNLPVRLERSGPAELKGSVTLSPYAPAGVWTISRFWMTDNDQAALTLESADPTFRHTLTVVPSDKPGDDRVPELVALSVPAEAEMGETVTIRATVKDNLSGVDYVTAYVEPADLKPGWQVFVELFATETPGEFSGVMLMDTTAMASQKQRIAKVTIGDQAGNVISVISNALVNVSANGIETKGKPRKVPEGLITSPYMNLIHEGDRTFTAWMAEDLRRALGHLAQARTDVKGVREALAAEVPQLRAAVDALRREVYVDPVTKLRVSPHATTGKWIALNAAMDARIELLIELDRRDGLAHSDRTELTQQELLSYYQYLSEGEFWLPADSLGDLYAQQTAAYLAVLAQSPEAVTALRTPAAESFQYGPADMFDRDLLYFEPIASGSGRPRLVWGTASFFIPVQDRQITPAVHDLFYVIGEHFGQAFFSAYDAEDFNARWGEYFAARSSQRMTGEEGYLGSPSNNLGDDFAWTYLPGEHGKQYYSRQSFPRLREHPEMAKAFRELVDRRLKQPLPAVAVTPVSTVEVGVTDTFQVTFGAASANPTLEAEGRLWNKSGWLRRGVPGTASGSSVSFRSTETVDGSMTWFRLQARQEMRSYDRIFHYYRAPVLLDAVPTATNQQVAKVTGRAAAGATVSAAGKSTVADSTGRFTLELPLTEGANKFRVTVTGNDLGASFSVRYEKPGPAPVSVTVPGVSSQKSVQLKVSTVPYATIAIGDRRFQADARGESVLTRKLEEGINKLEITVTSPAGNKGSWSGLVMVDSEGPSLVVSVPRQTNTPVLKVTGTVERGASLTLGDAVLTPAADGSFSVDVALVEGTGKKLEFTATDPAGNRTATSAEVRYVSGVPTVARGSSVTLSGVVEPGTGLQYDGKPVTVQADGTFSLTVPLTVGRNVFDLPAVRDGKGAGYLQFVVTNPFWLAGVVPAGEGVVTISGKAAAGFIVLVDGKAVPVGENGEWTAAVTVGGRSSIPVVVEGGGKVFEDVVIMP